MSQILYHAYLNNTGYSIAAQDYILSMLSIDEHINIKVSYMNIQIGHGVSSNRQQLFENMKKKPEQNEIIELFHCIPPRYVRKPGRLKTVGFCVFETINVPELWVQYMNNMDLVLTASDFNKNTFQNAGVTVPITVIPHCFDSDLFNHSAVPLERYARKTFMSIGTWKNRKNWDLLIKAWYEAFEDKDNVCLLIKTDKPHELKSLVTHIKSTTSYRTKNTAPIYSEDNLNCNFEQMPQIMKKADFYICCSRGEGFSLPVLHAMALKIPVITTRFGGVLQIAKPENCTYLEPDKYERILKMDNIPQFTNCIWPHLSVSEVSNKLKYALNNAAEIKKKSENAYDFVHKNCNYKTIGKLFLDSIQNA